ncbi:putative phytosulfokines 6 [Tripterygium wilfordii]|uniref:Phytosulfokine n=1 Tax=Tripterygium wilfordii TaxID=458696 RepID=A0A7J7DWK3_TRIWF|nr:putative phytosulfokines 6 [Tripterygium wilfordii]KAF5750476.1 putative phytosulfokines 6 [Tripterygium wilfordii]
MKKQNSHVFLISLFVLLLIVSSASARLLVPKLGAVQETKSYEIDPKETDTEHLTNLMGSEEFCAEKDEGCLEGRMLADAHLDYIYTQHHKP